MLLGPLTDVGELRAESIGDDVVGVADEDGPIAQARKARDVLDHLGVVVGGQERLGLAAVGHRQPADEVGQPAVRGALELGILMQEVVELPRLVADPEVVCIGLDEVVEDHEVGDEDLVHPPPRLEAMQVVLGGFGFDVRRLVGQLRAGRVDALAFAGQDARHRVLRQPVDLEIRHERAQLAGDRHVPLGVAEADRRGDVEGAPAACLRAGPGRCRGPARLDEVAQQQVDLHRVARVRAVAGALEAHERAADQLCECGARVMRADGVVAPVDHEDGAANLFDELAHARLVRKPPRKLARDHRLGVRLQRPLDRVLALLGRVRLDEDLREEELEEVLVVLDPVVAVPLSPAVVGVARLDELLLRARARRGRRQR